MRLLFTLCLLLPALHAAPYTDAKTALMWQDVPENKGVIHTWYEAKEYCETLDEAGFDDWWLPSEAELFTIVDPARPQGRKIRSGLVHFKGAPYWSASTYAWNAPHAWAVDFATGTSFTLEKEAYRFVRCVRCTDFKRCIELYYDKAP